MRIDVEINEGEWRQTDAERQDNGDDMTRNFTWLRLPEDVRVGLVKLLGGCSLDDLMARGIPRETALRVMDLYVTLM